MRKKHHIFFIANISLLLIAIILGLVFQGSISDCGISHLSNIKDVEDSHIVLNYAWNENDEGGLTLTSFGSDVDLYGVASAEIIVLLSLTTMLPNLMMVAKTMFISSTASRTIISFPLMISTP